MGKQLIIKNADFSENGMSELVPTWYLGYTDREYSANSVFSSSNKFYMKASEIDRLSLDGKTINFIKINCNKAGTISVGKTSGGSDAGGYSYSVSKGINIIHLKSSITLSSTVSIYLVGNGVIKYWVGSSVAEDETLGWQFSRIGTSTTYAHRIPVDLGYASED